MPAALPHRVNHSPNLPHRAAWPQVPQLDDAEFDGEMPLPLEGGTALDEKARLERSRYVTCPAAAARPALL